MDDDEKKARDGWSKADIVAKIIGSVMLPVVLALVGYRYTDRQHAAEMERLNQQRSSDEKRLAEQHDADAKRLAAQAKADEEQRNTDRLATLLKYLTSSNEAERYLGTIVVIALADEKKVPLELAQVVFTVSKEDASARVRRAGEEALARSVDASPDALLASVQRIATSSVQNTQALKSNRALDQTLKSIAEGGTEQQKTAAVATLRTLHPSVSNLATCPNFGAAEPSSPQAVMNEIKRRTPTGVVKSLTMEDFRRLQAQADALGIPTGRGADLSAEGRRLLHGLSTANGPVGEGDRVQVQGYVQAARAGGPESVNCYLSGLANSDFNITLTSKPSDPATEGIVVEMIPQNRAEEWSLPALRATQGRLVKVVGQLFYDNAHRVRDTPDQRTADPARMSVWEIHPVTEFLVCGRPDNACAISDPTGWIPLDKGRATAP